MLEEIGFEYKVTKIDLDKGEQFKSYFKKISPFSKIPVIIDHESNQSVFESGAILIYLAEKSGKFYDSEDRLKINQWLMAQMGYIGPMLGQHHQFHYYNPGKSKFGEDRYFKIAKRIYQELDERLATTKFLSGNFSARPIVYSPLPQPNSKTIGLLFLKNSLCQLPFNGNPFSSRSVLGDCTMFSKLAFCLNFSNLFFPTNLA